MADQEPREQALEDSGAYEVIRKRLSAQAAALKAKADALNAQREAAFGGTEMGILGSVRVRTENNCVPRDMAEVGGLLLFGYNVHIGLKSETRVQDVFGLYRLGTEQGVELEPVALEGSFLADPAFVRDFQNLFKYYKDSRLVQLRRLTGALLAVFQTGSTFEDLKVFRWRLAPDGSASYQDDRGERDNLLPPSHDFEWQETSREQHVRGKHPHVNILDQVFVETIGGDLTIKIENNTDDGQGIYREPVEDRNQTLRDAEISYARVGSLILLKILPYREQAHRYFVFNTRSRTVKRIDEIGAACRQLPEDHGIIFPGGYYLQNGETKVFDADCEDMYFLKSIRSPNGEDVLYSFYHEADGRFVLLSYNLIRKQLDNPILGNGFALLEDGTMPLFRSEDEPTRVHGLQIWQTPYVSDEFAANAPRDDSFLGKIGNPELVRAISELYSIQRLIQAQQPSVATYEDLIAAVTRTLDAYHWLGHGEVGTLTEDLHAIQHTAEQVLDEFEKVETIRGRAKQALTEAETEQQAVVREAKRADWSSIEGYVQALDKLRRQRGRLISLRDLRYVDVQRVEALEAAVVEAFQKVSQNTVDFLLGENALKPYLDEIERRAGEVEAAQRRVDLKPSIEALEQVGQGLNLLTEVVNELEIRDANARTDILDAISAVFGRLNQAKANADLRWKGLGSKESVAEFGAQFRLLSQSVVRALAMVDTPEKADQELSRLLLQLEELEGRFGEHEQFVADLAEKREEIFEAFESRKQALMEERSRRTQSLAQAAERILSGLARRAEALKDVDELNAFFASDAMALKLRGLIQELRELGESVRADDVEGRIKAARDRAIRALRDKLDIFEDGGKLIRFGRHRFSVNTQELDLTLLPREDGMALHLTGTDYYEPIADPALEESRDYWDQRLVSETSEVYRAEYLAASVLAAADAGIDGATPETLHAAQRSEAGLLPLVRDFAAARYDEGYERGVHDHDAAAILNKLLHLRDTAGLLRYGPGVRALAALYWAQVEAAERKRWAAQCAGYGRLAAAFGRGAQLEALEGELAERIEAFRGAQTLAGSAELAAAYLARELQAERAAFVQSGAAKQLVDEFWHFLDGKNQRHGLEQGLKELQGHLAAQLRLGRAWLGAFIERCDAQRQTKQRPVLEEAVAALLTDKLDRRVSDAPVDAEVTGLLGQHPRVRERTLQLNLPDFLERIEHHRRVRAPGFRAARELRHGIIERERKKLRLHEFKPRAMTSFVRNKLINEVYLPMIGDNLAKQMGAAGDNKRTDLMGTLLLISPPGYGKTMIMEYVASRLGLVFMKINCPALGHGVTSIDPAEATNAAARQELEKLNLGLEMGNNVMLYLDDIQHTNPEFLQKFISLCDAQRKIEGVWRGQPKTYDLRGKKFCVIMAGNPYTESGEAFKIPDMLANRADVYNLGDVLGGHQEAFELSYIENSLTSNSVLAPLASREMEDFYKLVSMAKGQGGAASELKHNYSGAEVSEIVTVLQHLFKVQDVVLKVNQQYIASAAQDDAYRTEPPFRLQGSYRNMNRLAEKVVAAMNAQELEQLISDDYRGEAQTLTTGAEENLLKLAELRGTLSAEEAERWEGIKKTFVRRQTLGGEDDPVARVVNQLNFLGGQIDSIAGAIQKAAAGGRHDEAVARLERALARLAEAETHVQVVNQPLPGLEEILKGLTGTIEASLLPVISTMDHKLRLDHNIWDTLHAVLQALKGVDPKSFEAISLDQSIRRDYSSEGGKAQGSNPRRKSPPKKKPEAADEA